MSEPQHRLLASLSWLALGWAGGNEAEEAPEVAMVSEVSA
jgi:hypothetical protein